MNSTRRLLQSGALLIFGFILGSMLLAGARTQGARAQEEPAAPPPAPAAADAADLVHTCTPLEISTFENRIHVLCMESAGSIRFFAASTANPANAARMLSTLTAAQLSGRALFVTYDPDDTSGEAFGCHASDCRRMSGVAVGQ